MGRCIDLAVNMYENPNSLFHLVLVDIDFS